MTTITISLPEDKLEKLQQLANELKIAPEKLVEASIEELIYKFPENFHQALRHVLHKNAELYRRLAQ